MKDVKCWENAKSQSFYARDNVCNFIKWCRFLSVREAVLFESEDLVLHNNQRNVVLCLLEVARIACTQFAFSPAPGLVQLEQEIDHEIELETVLTEQQESGAIDSGVENGTPGEARCCPDGVASVPSNEDGGCWSSEGASSPRRSPSAASLVSSASLASSAPSSGDASSFVPDNNASLLISQLDQKVSEKKKRRAGGRAGGRTR